LKSSRIKTLLPAKSKSDILGIDIQFAPLVATLRLQNLLHN
jgi:hypothetical protein